MEIFINGTYCSLAQARVGVCDRGFLFGDGVFTTLKVERSIPLFLHKHLERLQRSCAFFAIDFPDFDFPHIINNLLVRNQLTDARVKIMITRGCDSESRITIYPGSTPTVAIIISPLKTYDPAPVSLCIAPAVRGAEPIYHHKTTSYLQSLWYKALAQERECDDCIILDWHHRVCETSTANLFVVVRGALVTPPQELPILNGIMRQSLLDRGELAGYPVKEEQLAVSDLKSVQAAFITSAVVEICPVRSIERQPLPVEIPQMLRQAWIRLRMPHVR